MKRKRKIVMKKEKEDKIVDCVFVNGMRRQAGVRIDRRKKKVM